MMSGSDGRQSFTKWVVVVLIAMHGFKVAPGVIAEGMLLSAAFGRKTFTDWLNRGQWSASDTSITTKSESVTADRRVVGDSSTPGYEPTP